MARKSAPELTRAFETLLDAIGHPGEAEAVEAIYRDIPPVNFSRDFLERFPVEDPDSLAVLPVRGVYWSDWGSIHRVVSDLREMGQFGQFGLIEENQYLVAG